MTEIEQKGLALVNEVLKERGLDTAHCLDRNFADVEALCRAIEQREATMREAAEREERLVEEMRSGIARAEAQHEATKQEHADYMQEVSDTLLEWCGGTCPAFLAGFLLPEPNPDPLVDVLLEMKLSSDLEIAQHGARYLRAALDAAGFEIKEKSK